jgi:hypothetical protein
MRAFGSGLHGASTRTSRARSGGQIVVIFAGSIVLFVLLCGVVVDIAYYWVGMLQAQRAADAAALAGAVYLPGDTTTAYAVARSSAAQNNFAVGGNVLTVTPVQDGGDPRQLDVTITARIPTFFSRVVGISSWAATVTAKGVYILPVPMGSPDAYYGVGNYSVNQTTTNRSDYTNASVPSYTSASWSWSNPNYAWSTGYSYSTSTSNNQAQQWYGLRIPSISGSTLDGVVVSFKAKDSAAVAACEVRAQISWDGGSTWSNSSPDLTTPSITTSATSYSLGSATDMSVWGDNHSWGTGDFGNTSFRVQLTHLKGSGCGTLSVNSLVVTVYSHTTTPSTTTVTTAGVSDGATFLASRGAWGAVITKGGNQQNGDAYAPANNSGYSPTMNEKYDPAGYDYVVNLPAGGVLKVFDPGFCAMGSNGAGGSLGAGDHWIGGNTGTAAPVSTYYTLWNTNGKPGLRSAWTELYTSGGLFEGQTGYDPDNMGVDGGGSKPANTTDTCDAHHDAWWTIPTGTLPAGNFALQVQTTKTAHSGVSADSSQNENTNAENMFAIEAVGGGSPQIYGNGRMAVYNNLMGAGTQQFYLAQIDRQTGAGKTALIDLFDPGDLGSGSTGTLQVLSPDGGTPHAVNFSYTTDANCRIVSGASPCSGNNVNSITTTSTSGQATNNTWIHIAIPLSNSYGSAATGGLWNNGWWQIQYIVSQGGNDTTTWQVSVSGNPVHLLVP